MDCERCACQSVKLREVIGTRRRVHIVNYVVACLVGKYLVIAHSDRTRYIELGTRHVCVVAIAPD